MNNKLEALIKDYLEKQKLMQLATVSDGKPWACSVWQASDDDLNIYFFSAITRRHSIEIEDNSNIAGALALPHTPEDKPRGLQFEGTVTQLTDESDISSARKLYQGRIFDGPTIDGFMSHPDRPHVFYKITPKLFVLFDTVNFPDDPRKEYSPQDE